MRPLVTDQLIRVPNYFFLTLCYWSLFLFHSAQLRQFFPTVMFFFWVLWHRTILNLLKWHVFLKKDWVYLGSNLPVTNQQFLPLDHHHGPLICQNDCLCGTYFIWRRMLLMFMRRDSNQSLRDFTSASWPSILEHEADEGMLVWADMPILRLR